MKSARLFLLLLLGLSAGCGGKETPRPVSIVVSGDTEGWIVPCGCASNQSGGLPRRASFIRQRQERETVIPVDAGGAGGGTTLYDKVKFEAILQGESAMKIAAHNIGRSESGWGEDELRRLHKKWKTPWISANTTDAAENPLAPPARMVEAGKRKILFVGVLSQEYKSDSVRIAPPRQAILKTLKDHAGRYDHVVVLAYVPEEELRELARTLPEVDAVVGGPTGQPVPPEYPQGHVLAISATKQGKYLAKVTLPLTDERSNRMRGEIVELDERFKDDPAQTGNVRKFYDELARLDLSAADTPFAEFLPPSRDSVAGVSSCQNCHEEEYEIWKTSRHARAWRSLVDKGAQYDPDCQRCHVTGYGQGGGFESAGRSRDRVDVSCESCHGPASEHCRKTSVRTVPAERRKRHCRTCHDKENSPLFDDDVYWAKIRHGIDSGDDEKSD